MNGREEEEERYRERRCGSRDVVRDVRGGMQ